MNGQRDFATRRYALLGGNPAFAAVPAQDAAPAWQDYERAFTAIFERQYYTNQGPLTEQLEARLAQRLQTRHAVCVANHALALTMLTEALVPAGNVAVPALAENYVPNALRWAQRGADFCDTYPGTHEVAVSEVQSALERGATAILGIHSWSGLCDIAALQALAERFGVPLYFDSSRAFGRAGGARPVGGYGAAEVFSLREGDAVCAGEGGCISTDDDELAERLRNIRSSYGTRRTVTVHRTANGRMSEAQAALALLSLDTLDERLARRARQHSAFGERLGDIPGIRVMAAPREGICGSMSVVCEVDEARFGIACPLLVRILRAEGLDARPCFADASAHWLARDADRLPNAVQAARTTFRIPLGDWMTQAVIERMADLLREVQRDALSLRAAMEDAA